ncbi:potassium-transporting ATPase subunit KdpA [soil metagenome]
MTVSGITQLCLFFAVLLALVKPLGWFMARVYESAPGHAPLGLGLIFGPVERLIYTLAGIRHPDQDSVATAAAARAQGDPAPLSPLLEMGWKHYTVGIVLFNALGFIAVYAIQRFQHFLPANATGLGQVSPDSSFNTAISFITNTNWQGYGGEVTMSYLTQMLALGVQNFFSAATGLAVLVALIRGLSRRSSRTIGNCWIDLTRSTLYILLPLSLILACVLVTQGVVQTFRAPQEIALTVPTSYADPVKDAAGVTLKNADGTDKTVDVKVLTQSIPLGPAASQIAIKQLGTNGGGFYSVNSAHPLENPTQLSNFLQVLSILLIPAALCWTFGEMVRDRRQGWAVLAAMLVIFVPLLAATYAFEAAGNPRLAALLVDQAARPSTNTPVDEAFVRAKTDTPAATPLTDTPAVAAGATSVPALTTSATTAPHSGGNMEGKETRFGIANSALWAAATTAASNGSVNSMHDSFSPLGGLIPMWLIQLGEVVFGGVGSGLYGMLMFVIVAVFVAGLMVGRTPEYLGKKIDPFEMKMAALAVLVPCGIVLLGTAAGVLFPGGATTSNPGAHGFSQILYAFSSAGNNNGSAFAGLSANTPFYNLALGTAMFFSRYWIIVPVLAVAGSLAAKKRTPATSGTLPTHTPVFVTMLVAVVIIVGALTFVPALALGPIAEELQTPK